MRIRAGMAMAALMLLTANDTSAQQCDTFDDCKAGMCQDGECVGVPLNTGPCDDDNPCTTNDSCMNGECHGTPTSGGSCEDPFECTIDDTCMAVGDEVFCVGSTPAEPGTPCAGGCGTCQEGVPLCLLTEGKLNQPCTLSQDLGPCIVGKCALLGVAQCLPSAKECADDDGDPCTGELCNEETGSCETVPVPVRLECFPPDCHRCEPSTGQCVPTNVGGSCDDFDECSTSTVCNAEGGCVAGAPQPSATPTGTPGPGTPTPTSPVALNTATPTRTPGTPAATATPGRCVGDCNNNGQVLVNELVTGVSIALDRADFAQCPQFDVNGNNGVEVNELVSGVNSLLRGCVAAALSR